MHVPDFPGFLPLVLSGQQSDSPPPPTYVCSELNGEWRSVNKTPKFLPPPPPQWISGWTAVLGQEKQLLPVMRPPTGTIIPHIMSMCHPGRRGGGF